jgi:WD40 repeat protein
MLFWRLLFVVRRMADGVGIMDPLKPGDPNKVGKYRLTGRLGGGGMGRVFLGVSPGGRQVAVKVIHSELADDKQFRQRFAREIEAARRVGGFHTPPVVDADPHADPPWMVTAFINGPALYDAVAERGPLSPDEVCTLGAELAEGLAAIHVLGLVHRDLKPSNVILAEDGPRIIDFGIARAADASRITNTGFVIGTYSYMSPEQVRGQVAGPASDVFSLGCTLAFAASGNAPFGDDSIASVVHRIISEPPDLKALPHERGLRQLISECLAKSPDDRPTLADILTRLTETAAEPETGTAAEPETGTAAEPDTGAAAAEPATGRRPTADPSSPDAAHRPETGSALDSGAADETSSAQRYEPTQTIPRSKTPEPGSGDGTVPLPAKRRPVPHLSRRTAAIVAGATVAALIAAGLGIALSSGPTPSTQSSGRSPSPSASPSSRSSSASPPALPEATLHDPGGKSVFGVVFGSNGVLAAGDSNGSTYVWSAATGKLMTTLRASDADSVNSVAFSPLGNIFASADANGSTYLWNAASDQLIATLQDPSGQGNDSVAFSPDGDFVAAGSQEGTIRLWNVASGKIRSAPTATLHDPGGKDIYGVAFSPDGSLIAAGDTNGNVYLWNVTSDKVTATLHDPDSQGIYDVAFSPDQTLLAVSDVAASDTGVVYLWNTATGKLTATLQPGDNGQISDIAFSPDGRFLAAADTEGGVVVWNVATGDLLDDLAALISQPLIGVAFSPDGDTLASTNTKGDTFVWNARWLYS